MSNENYILSVYSALTGQIEDIQVTEAVYNEYRRGGWRLGYSDQRFRDHETVFSELKGGLDGAYENFREFRSDQDNPERLVIASLTRQELQQAWDGLADSDRKLLQALLIEGKSVREVAAMQGVSHNAVHKKKQRLIKYLQIFLE